MDATTSRGNRVDAEGVPIDTHKAAWHRGRNTLQLQRACLTAWRGTADESLRTKLGEVGHHNCPDVSALPRRTQLVRSRPGRCFADHCSLEARVLSRLSLERGSRETHRRL